LASNYGYQSMPWELVTQITLGTLLVLTSLAMFLRPDFMSLTVCTLGIYSVQNPDNITRTLFRMLVLFSVISFLYDLVYLLFIHNSSAVDAEFGDMQAGVRKFAFFFCWISFAFRPVVILVLWKDSLDFRKIVRQKQDSMGSGAAGDTM